MGLNLGAEKPHVGLNGSQKDLVGADVGRLVQSILCQMNNFIPRCP